MDFAVPVVQWKKLKAGHIPEKIVEHDSDSDTVPKNLEKKLDD